MIINKQTKVNNFNFAGIAVVVMMSRVSTAHCPTGSGSMDYSITNCGIREVPTDIPTEAIYVDLSNNRIGDIGIGMFSHLKACEELSLYYNNLTHLRPGMFSGLVTLYELDLGYNRISVIETGTFSELGNCMYLTLATNALVQLVPGMFKGLGALGYNSDPSI